MTEPTHQVPSTTPDFSTEAATKTAKLFPETVADGKTNFEALKTVLVQDVENDQERFGLTWPGKRDALRAAQTPTTATLGPVTEESVNWDTTQNVFIEGDNLADNAVARLVDERMPVHRPPGSPGDNLGHLHHPKQRR